MEENAENFYRSQIKDGLAMLEDKHRLLFKRMYSHGNLEKPMNSIVDDMEEEKLDHALFQINGSLKKRNINNAKT